MFWFGVFVWFLAWCFIMVFYIDGLCMVLLFGGLVCCFSVVCLFVGFRMVV